MPDHKPSELTPSDFTEAARRSQHAGIADEAAAYESAMEQGGPASVDKGNSARKHGGSSASGINRDGAAVTTGPTRMNDDDVVKLAQAERDAGVPDLQTAAAAAEAKRRQAAPDAEIEAHPN